MSTNNILRPSILGRRLSVAEMEANMDIMAKPASGVTSICDRPYGAKGDGNVDDTDAIAMAIDAAAAAYITKGIPQVVLLPVGVYSVRYITLKSGVTLQGAGWATVIAARLNARVIRLAPEGQTQTPCKEASIQDLCIMGMINQNPSWSLGAPEGTCQAIGLEGSTDPDNTVLIQNVAIVGTRREGIYLDRMNARIKDVYLHSCGIGTEAIGGGITLKNCYDVTIEGVDASNVKGNHGLKIVDPLSTWSCSNLKVTKPYAHGIHLIGGTSAGFMHMITIENCPQRPIFIGEEAQNIVIDSVRVGLSTGGFPAVSLYKAKNVSLQGLFTYGTPEGVRIEGGSEYGHVRISGLFSTGNRLVVPDGCVDVIDHDTAIPTLSQTVTDLRVEIEALKKKIP